jgi:hypothetical protein
MGKGPSRTRQGEIVTEPIRDDDEVVSFGWKRIEDMTREELIAVINAQARSARMAYETREREREVLAGR